MGCMVRLRGVLGAEGREGEWGGNEKSRRGAECGAHDGKDNQPAFSLDIEARMREAATNLDFETAARLRDELFEVKAKAGREERSRGSLAGLHAR